MLVAHVLVAEPRRSLVGVGEHPLPEQHRGVVGAVVIRVGQPERREHRRRGLGAHRGLEFVDDLFGSDPVGTLEVGVLDEVEPHRLGVEPGERRRVLGASGDVHLVAGTEAAERVPVLHRVRIHRGTPRERGDDGDPRVRGHQVRAAKDRIVEVRRDDHQARQLRRRDRPPVTHVGRCGAGHAPASQNPGRSAGGPGLDRSAAFAATEPTRFRPSCAALGGRECRAAASGSKDAGREIGVLARRRTRLVVCSEPSPAPPAAGVVARRAVGSPR